jgi:hypothetical protein
MFFIVKMEIQLNTKFIEAAQNELRIHVAQGRQNEVAGERVVESSRSMLNQAESRHIIPVGLSQIPYGI